MILATGKLPIRGRASRLIWLVLVLIVAGCTKDQDYLDVKDEKLAALTELTEILKTVKDAQTMGEAKRTLQGKSERYEAISRKASALPMPPPERVQQRIKEEMYVIQRIFDHYRTETVRINGLPGGPEFLTQFESTKRLLAVVQP